MKSPEMSEFFSLLGQAKKEKEEEFDNLLKEANVDIDSLVSSTFDGIKKAEVEVKEQKRNEEKLIAQLDNVLELAQESDSARAYEVAGQMIKSVGDTTDKLIDLQQKMKELDEQPKGPTNVTNALFVGSTAELSKLIKAQKKDDK